MKKIGLLSFVVLFLALVAQLQPAFGQTCTPTVTGNSPGLYPDPLPAGCVGQPYTLVVDFIFPLDTPGGSSFSTCYSGI